MAKRNVKDWITSYMHYTRFSEAPDQFHKWTAISTIAGALRKRVWFDMGYFKWTPNFFIFFVGPSGVATKSTSMDVGFRLLREVPGINFGPTISSWQALVKNLGECTENIILENGDWQPMSAMNLAVSELGTLIDPKNKDLLDVLTDLWDGKESPLIKSTKYDGGDIVINPWVNMIGCTTPSWIAENVGSYFIGGGFSSRAVFVYGDRKRQLVANPKKLMRQQGAEHETLAQQLIEDLGTISQLYGEYELTPEAEALDEEWYARHHEHKEIVSSFEEDKFIGYHSRKQGHARKVAMVLAASRRDELVITKTDLQDALEEVTRVEADMKKVFGYMNQEAEMVIAADILSLVRKEKTIQKPLLYRKFMRVITYTTFEKVLSSLANGKMIAQREVSGINYIRAIYDDDASEAA